MILRRISTTLTAVLLLLSLTVLSQAQIGTLQTWDTNTTFAGAGWTSSNAAMQYFTGSSEPSAYSSTNDIGMFLATGSLSSAVSAYYSTADTGTAGRVYTAYLRFANNSSGSYVLGGLYARMTSGAYEAAGNTGYYLYFQKNTVTPGTGLYLGRKNAGTTTDLSATIPDTAFAYGGWYKVVWNLSASPITVQVQRPSFTANGTSANTNGDNKWLNSSGTWVTDATNNTVAISVTDSSPITANGYYGVFGYEAGSAGAFTFDNLLYAATSTSSFTTTPTSVVASSTGNVITLVGTGTNWTSGTTTFTVSGNGTKTAQTITDTTHATVTLTAGAAVGSANITLSDGTASANLDTTSAPVASFTVSPTNVYTNSVGNVITLVGTNTAWTSGTVFSVAGATKTTQTFTDATHATVTLTAGATAGAGNISISDNADSATNTLTTLQASFSRSPTSIVASSVGNVITLVGTGTQWTSGTIFTVTGATKTAQTFTDATHYTVTLTAGSSAGTNNVTLSDGTLSTTLTTLAAGSVTSGPIVATDPTGEIVYTVIISNGQAWNGTAFTNIALANWTTYANSLSEQTGTGVYIAQMPAGITTPGQYGLLVYKQSGANPSPTADTIIAKGNIEWTGTSTVGAAVLNTNQNTLLTNQTALQTGVTGIKAQTDKLLFDGSNYVKTNVQVLPSVTVSAFAIGTTAPATLFTNLPAVQIGSYAANQDPATLVLGATASSWTTAGSIGQKLNAAGAAGNPWTTDISSGYTGAQAGNILYAIRSGQPVTLPTTPPAGYGGSAGSDPWGVLLTAETTTGSFGAFFKAQLANPVPSDYQQRGQAVTLPAGVSNFYAPVTFGGSAATASLVITITPNGAGKPVLSWTADSLATSYKVLRSTDGVSYTVIASGLTATTYTDATTVSGTQYRFAIISLH